MHSYTPPKLGRWAPFAVAVVMSAVFAGPAFGQAVVDVTYNTSNVLIAEMNSNSVTVTRNGNEIPHGPAPGPPGRDGLKPAQIPGCPGLVGPVIAALPPGGGLPR